MQRTSSYSSHTMVLPPRAPEALVYDCELWQSSQQQEPLQKAIPICSDSSAVAAFISGNSKSHQTNAELTKSTALTALKADVPSQQQVRLGLQLSQLLHLRLHQDCPCSSSGTTHADQRRGQYTVLKAANAIAPHGFSFPRGTCPLAKTCPDHTKD